MFSYDSFHSWHRKQNVNTCVWFIDIVRDEEKKMMRRLTHVYVLNVITRDRNLDDGRNLNLEQNSSCCDWLRPTLIKD